MSFTWLLRTIGCLAAVPDLGCLIRPIVFDAKFGYKGATYDASRKRRSGELRC